MVETCIGRVLSFEDGGDRIALPDKAPRGLARRDLAPTFAGALTAWRGGRRSP